MNEFERWRGADDAGFMFKEHYKEHEVYVMERTPCVERLSRHQCPSSVQIYSLYPPISEVDDVKHLGGVKHVIFVINLQLPHLLTSN